MKKFFNNAMSLVCPVCFACSLFLFLLSDIVDTDDTYSLICVFLLMGLTYDHLFLNPARVRDK